MNVEFDVKRLIKDFNGKTRLSRSLSAFKRSKQNNNKVTINAIAHWKSRKSISNENLMWLALLSKSKKYSTFQKDEFDYLEYINLLER